jgi:hypothetical protein
MDSQTLRTLLNYCQYVVNRKGVQAQHKVVTSDGEHWLGCYVIDVTGGRVTIEIANGDKFTINLEDIRIPGI